MRDLKLILLTLVLGVILGEIYSRVVGIGGFTSPMLTIAVVNFFLCIPFFVYYRLKDSYSVKAFLPITSSSLKPFIPSVLICLFIATCILLSSLIGDPTPGNLNSDIWLSVLLVPLVEETLFRGGFSKIFRSIGDKWRGIYFSSIFFSFCHTLPTFSSFMELDLGLLLGPFLLGIICEYIYSKSNSLIPCVIFHMSCNLSVAVFYWFDTRWFSWLSYFYS